MSQHNSIVKPLFRANSQTVIEFTKDCVLSLWETDQDPGPLFIIKVVDRILSIHYLPDFTGPDTLQNDDHLKEIRSWDVIDAKQYLLTLTIHNDVVEVHLKNTEHTTLKSHLSFRHPLLSTVSKLMIGRGAVFVSTEMYTKQLVEQTVKTPSEDEKLNELQLKSERMKMITIALILGAVTVAIVGSTILIAVKVTRKRKQQPP